MGFIKKGIKKGLSVIIDDSGAKAAAAAAKQQEEQYRQQLQQQINQSQLNAANAGNEVADVVIGGSASDNDKSLQKIRKKKTSRAIGNSLGITS